MTRLIPAGLGGGRLFDLWSNVYDLAWFQRAAYRPVHDAVLAELHRRGVKRVLDVGCGTGLLAARLGRELPGVRAVGYDLSSGMLARARARVPRGQWIRGDALRLAFRDGAFDTLVSTESFHWIPDPKGALSEFRRVLAPGGCAVIALVNPRLPVVSRVARELSSWLGQPADWPSPERMRAQVEEAGLRVETQRRIERWTLGPLWPALLTVAVRPGPEASEPGAER